MNKNTINDPRCHKLGYSWRGWIPNFKGGGRWMLFATEEEYHEYYNEAVIDSWKKAS